MKVIWKYPLESRSEQKVMMPKKAHFLSVQVQGGDYSSGFVTIGRVCLWALVETEEPREELTFHLALTGRPISDDLLERTNYIGTAQLHRGSTVYHIFVEYPK